MTDYSEEIAFWDVYLSAVDVPAFDRERRGGFFPDEIIPCLYELIERSGELPRLLDVGAGPISQLAWATDEGLAEVVGVDPLADEYAAILERRGCSYPVVPVAGTGEKILEIFGAESMDLVYCGNALDHVENPLLCMRNIEAVLRPGGFMVIVSALREGTHQNWQGLHQHDLVPQDEDLWRYNKAGGEMCLTQGRPLQMLFRSMTGQTPGDPFTLIYEKLASEGETRRLSNSPSQLIHYWLRKHAEKEMARTDPDRREIDFPKILVELDDSGWRDGDTPPDVLEVGSGPLSRLAFAAENGLLTLTAVDPLAHIYVDLLERHGYTYPVAPMRCAAEDLLSGFDLESFDLIYAGDVLECCTDSVGALGSLTSMAALLRPGGALVLEGTARIGTELEWAGGQLNDVYMHQGRLFIRGREGEAWDVVGTNKLTLTRCVEELGRYEAILLKS